MSRKSNTYNQDYYKVAGASVGRRTYTKEKGKLSEKKASTPATGPRKKSVPVSGPGATETVRIAQKHRAEQAAKAVRNEEVERAVQASSPSAPPERQLPPAQLSTSLSDLQRQFQDDVNRTRAAVRELYDSLTDLARSPMRLFRLLRAAATLG